MNDPEMDLFLLWLRTVQSAGFQIYDGTSVVDGVATKSVTLDIENIVQDGDTFTFVAKIKRQATP